MRLFTCFLSAVIFAIGFVTVVNPMELEVSAPATATVTLVSSDLQAAFEIPLEVAEQVPKFRDTIRETKESLGWESLGSLMGGLRIPTGIPGSVLSEIVQVLKALYQHKNLTAKQFFDMFEKKINIHNDAAFLRAVEKLDFKPGIFFIFQKYAESSYFPQDEYDYWMKRIQSLDSLVYATLKKCEAENGKPCILKGTASISNMISIPDKQVYGYPIIIIEPGLSTEYESAIENALKFKLYNYKDDLKLLNQKKNVMGIIKDIAPSLYKVIVAIDAYGFNHIKIDDTLGTSNAGVAPSTEDGLPLFVIGSEIINKPQGELRFIIAHELGHYALGHYGLPDPKRPRPTHKELQKTGTEEFKKGKKVSGQLDFGPTLSTAFNRTQELEADRFAIIELGVSIDDAIAGIGGLASTKLEQQLKAPEKATFTRTHPLAAARIKQLEDLRPEVDLYKAQKRQPKPIDWEALAAEYRGK